VTPSTATQLPGPTLEDFYDAKKVLAGVAQETPMEYSRYLEEVLGVPVYLKCENLQRTGAYKIRGAYYCISKLSDDEKARGVVAASAGNHAQGVAFAARELGIAATIFTPLGVALPKLQATRAYGADVVLGGDTMLEPFQKAKEFAEATGAVRIPPFDHPDIIAGQGMWGLKSWSNSRAFARWWFLSEAAGSWRVLPVPCVSKLQRWGTRFASLESRQKMPPRTPSR
jgi:threonine dehydratase